MRPIECWQKKSNKVENKSHDGNISDVVRPGQTAATPTSKPIITDPGPLAADPFLQPKAVQPSLDHPKPDHENQARINPQASKDQVVNSKAYSLPAGSADKHRGYLTAVIILGLAAIGAAISFYLMSK